MNTCSKMAPRITQQQTRDAHEMGADCCGGAVVQCNALEERMMLQSNPRNGVNNLPRRSFLPAVRRAGTRELPLRYYFVSPTDFSF